MTRKLFWRALEILGAISLLVGIVTAPFVVPNIENPLYRNIVWGLFIPLVVIVALSIGFMPYWGMRDIKRVIEGNLLITKARIDELLPLEQVAKSQRDNPVKFMSTRINALMVAEEQEWVSTDVVVASRLPYRIHMKKVHAELWFLKSTGTRHRYDFETHEGDSYSVSGEANEKEAVVRVHVKEPQLAQTLVGALDASNHAWANVEGKLYITSDSGQLVLPIAEHTSVKVIGRRRDNDDELSLWLAGE